VIYTGNALLEKINPLIRFVKIVTQCWGRSKPYLAVFYKKYNKFIANYNNTFYQVIF